MNRIPICMSNPLAAVGLEREYRPRVTRNTLFYLPRGWWVVVVMGVPEAEYGHLDKANKLSSVGECRHSAQGTTISVSDMSAA